MSDTSDFAHPREPPSRADLIERVLDRGIVIDAQYHVSVAGVHLMTLDMWLVAASLATHKNLTARGGAKALGLELPPWMGSPGAQGPPGPGHP